MEAKAKVIWCEVRLRFLTAPLLNSPYVTLDAPVLWRIATRRGGSNRLTLEDLYDEANPFAIDENFIPMASSPVAASFTDAAEKLCGARAIVMARSLAQRAEVLETQGGEVAGAVLTCPHLVGFVLRNAFPGFADRMGFLREAMRGAAPSTFFDDRSGPMRSHLVRFPYRVFVTSLTFLAGLKPREGWSPEEVAGDFVDLLEEVGALGKLTRLGYGRFTVEEARILREDEDEIPRWPLDREGRVLRPYPVRLFEVRGWSPPKETRVGIASFLPPYWFETTRGWCYLPKAAFPEGDVARVVCPDLEHRLLEGEERNDEQAVGAGDTAAGKAPGGRRKKRGRVAEEASSAA